MKKMRRVAPLWSIGTMLLLLVIAFLLSFALMDYHPYNLLGYVPWLINLIAIPVYWMTGAKCMKETMNNDSTEKIPVVSFDFDLKSGKVENEHKSFLYKDEEPDCKYFHYFDETGCLNVCEGNQPYSCHRAKKEGLCHKEEKKS